MKRKTSSNAKVAKNVTVVAKKQRLGNENGVEGSDGAQRACPFEIREKVVGFYGGWPYIGVIQSIADIEMTFDKSYVLLIKWQGFSGKNAVTWTSEFDTVELTDESLRLKTEVWL